MPLLLMPWDFLFIFLFLAVVVPWRGYVRLQRLLAMPAIESREKIAIYAATIAFQWLITAFVAWRAVARGLTANELGLSNGNWVWLVFYGSIGAVLIGGLQWFNLRRIGKMSGEAPALMRKLTQRLLPLNLVEYLPFSALAVTAGICEEFLYRGFALGAALKEGFPLWLAVLLTSVLFGLAHAYQGKSGIVSTAILGVLLAIGRVAFSSLIPVMMWHAGLDLAAGLAAPRYLLKAGTDDK